MFFHNAHAYCIGSMTHSMHGNLGMLTPTDWELRLGYLIHDVSRLRRTLFDKWLSPLGITRSQWWVLAFLSRNDGMPQTDLALELDVGKVALGALIDRLEDGGFVKRMLDPDDRRVKRVVLTKQSAALIDTLRERNALFNQRILAGISRGDIEVTTETLRVMKHNLIDNASAFDPVPDAPPPRTEPRKNGARSTRRADAGARALAAAPKPRVRRV